MEIACRSDIGKVRQKNEDSVGYFKNQAGIVFAIVADGLGAYQGGEVASEMAVFHLGKAFEQTTFTKPANAVAWLEEQTNRENQQILITAQQDQKLAGMATTLVCALIFEDEIILANLGDSRGYLLRDDQFVQLTEDHSLVNELVKLGEISKEQARNHPQKNKITRTLGIYDNPRLDVKFFEAKADDVVLLCSDGLTNMLSDKEITTLLLQPSTLQYKVDALVQAANDAGGKDNITVLLCRLAKEDSV